MFYFFIFVYVIILSFLAQKSRRNRWISLILYISAAIPLIVVAGYRDVEVASDTGNYPMTVFESRRYFQFDLFSLIEPLYAFLGYLTYKINGNFNTLLLITHIVIVGSFWLGFWRMRKYVPLWMASFFFCFLFFNMSLQLSRQSIAVGLVFLGFTFLIERKLWVFLLYILIGSLFHRSAIAAIILVPFIYMNNNKFILQLIMYGSVISLFCFTYILSLFTSFLAFEKYESYAEGGDYEGMLSSSELILRLFFLSFMLIATRRKLSAPLMLMFITEFFLNLLQIRSRFLGRIGLYIYTLYFCYIPFYLSHKVSKLNRTLWRGGIFMFVIFYWWFVYIYKEAGETYPYSSKILGI